MQLDPPNTERLLLRKIRPTDLSALIVLDSDPQVMRYLSNGVANTKEDYLREGGLLGRMCAFSDDDPLGYFAAQHNGEFIGWFHLRPSVFDSKIPEVGYRLSRKWWGQGFATEGAKALCSWALNGLGFPAVDGCSDPNNTASIRVLEKCGLKLLTSRPHPTADFIVNHYQVKG